MDENSKTALLLGASGLVGGHCLRTLLEAPSYERVVSVSRRALPDVAHPKLVQKVLPLETLSALDLPQVDDVFCALGTTIRKAGSQAEFRRIDYELPLAAAGRALKFGAKQFLLVSSIGADSKSKNFYLRTKGELEDALKRLPFEALHLFQPSFLVGKREESRFGESVAIPAAKIFQFLLIGALRRYRSISSITVGRAMVAAAKAHRKGSFVWQYDEINRLAQSLFQ